MMKLKYETVIDASLDTVWAAFDNPDNMTRWQHNLESFTHVSGEAGQPGAVSELVFDEKGRKVVLTETITERRQPDFDENSTRWTAWCNFTFRGVMKVVSLFVAGTIRKRTEADMQRFKLMVETDRANAAS
jgi:uncharacterized protein YndB with AHSA1/START domain